MATNAVPVPSSIHEAEELIDSFIIVSDEITAGFFADCDPQYEALFQYACTSEVSMAWVLTVLSTRARVTEEPFIALQYLWALNYVIAKEPRARRSALRVVWMALDALAFQPVVHFGDDHLRSMARGILHRLVDHRRENIIQDI